MYLFDYAYPAAKELLNSCLSTRQKVDAALRVCRQHCKQAYWDRVMELDFEAEQQRLAKFWQDLRKSPPPADLEVLWIALHDLPERFSLLGAPE